MHGVLLTRPRACVSARRSARASQHKPGLLRPGTSPSCRHTAVHRATLDAPPFFRLASPPSIQRTNPSHYTPRCATTSKICTARASRRVHTRPSPPRARRPTTLRVGGLVAKLSAIHFRPPQIQWVRCNTFLTGCQPPWPPPHCPHLRAAFMVSVLFRRPLSPPPGSSLLAGRAYHSPPTSGT